MIKRRITPPSRFTSIKSNNNMLKSWNFFSDLKRKGKYIAYRKLTRNNFTPQQVHDTVTKMRAQRKTRLIKRLIAIGIVMIIFVALIIVINKRYLF